MDDSAPVEPAETDQLLAPLRLFSNLVLAVSGGADSMALLHLVQAWLPRTGLLQPGQPPPAILIATVDHRLRPEAADEAATVARRAAELGFPHVTLAWDGPHPKAGLQEAAREARYDLLHAAALRLAMASPSGSVAIVTAHTADDQAETLLMRFARGSGVDGLAGIPGEGRVVRRQADGCLRAVPVLRPLLGVPRARLVATLAAAGIAHIDDPSNRDRRFERVRVRDVLRQLEPLGVTGPALARTAARMQRARAALEAVTDDLEARAVTAVPGLLLTVDRAALADAPAEIAVRLLRRLLDRAGGASGPPELSAIEAACAKLTDPSRAGHPAFTLGGCIIDDAADPLRIYREPDRDGGLPVLPLAPGQALLWDRRFLAQSASDAPDATVGPLGEDWAGLIKERAMQADPGLPAAVIRAMPAIRVSGRILAVPSLAAIARAQGGEAAARSLIGPVRLAGSPAGPADEPLFRLTATNLQTQC